ncbi:N-acetyltransferase [Rhizocola hellebori]|uniref:N-acetyltransferase n=1 Tax=Rhizocola hellebori TaxID=1392758 RepID=A0A8J3QDN2_9ACTN|nr:N-acetyltransferase [Rhizocola hellebori]
MAWAAYDASVARNTPIPPPTQPLTDEHVVLRRRQEDDLDAMVAASHDPETLRWLDDPPMDDEIRRTTLSRADEAWRSGRAAPMTIADAATGRAVGTINLTFREEQVASLAYSVFPAYRGQGIAPRAVQLMSEWALGELGVTQLLLEADADNAASIRVAEKCGFQATGKTPVTDADGTVRHRLVFSLTPLM